MKVQPAPSCTPAISVTLAHFGAYFLTQKHEIYVCPFDRVNPKFKGKMLHTVVQKKIEKTQSCLQDK